MSLLSDLSDLFSIRRREACASNSSAVKPSADGGNRSRRRSLSAKCQTFFSNVNQDWKSTIEATPNNKQATKTVDSAIPPISDVTSTSRVTVSPVTNVEPQESESKVSHKPAEDPETPEKPRLRRRPKTPIRRVGELEGYTELSIQECSSALAEQYQAVIEPWTGPQSPMTPRSLRKIEGRPDLRRTSLDSDSEPPMSPNLSDSETVVGSDRSARPSSRIQRLDSNNSFCSYGSSWSTNSTSSYYSASSEGDSGVPEKGDYTKSRKVPEPKKEFLTKPIDAGHNIEIKICLDLLKQDLSSTMSPSNPSDSTFGLQLWLMIESYESIKRRLHQKLPATLGGKETSEFTFQVLDHWLEALYSVYNALLQDGRASAEKGRVAAKIGATVFENDVPEGALCV